MARTHDCHHSPRNFRFHDVHHEGTQARVKGVCSAVHEQEVWFFGDCTGQEKAQSLACCEGPDLELANPSEVDLESLQEVACARRAVAEERMHLVGPQGSETPILRAQSGHCGDRLTRSVLEAEPAGVVDTRPAKARQRLDEKRLAGAHLTHEDQALAASQGEVNGTYEGAAFDTKLESDDLVVSRLCSAGRLRRASHREFISRVEPTWVPAEIGRIHARAR
jgi:hypothetical protein